MEAYSILKIPAYESNILVTVFLPFIKAILLKLVQGISTKILALGRVKRYKEIILDFSLEVSK